MRIILKNIYKDIFSTILSPKSDEIIATKFRFNGNKQKAKEFFENNMISVLNNLYKYSSELYPVTIYYAFKQTDSIKNTENSIAVSSGWETMLSAIIQAGFIITGTWPMRTELANRTRSLQSNALASSIVLVCRKRPQDAIPGTRRYFINALRQELKPALLELQRANIAPVDLAQAAIGPGIGIYSRYSHVLESDGSILTVRESLAIINQELDRFFSDQDSDLDPESSLCLNIFSEYGYNDVNYGEIDILARAKNTSIENLINKKIIQSNKGKIQILTRKDISDKIDYKGNIIWLLTQQLTKSLQLNGITACANIVINIKPHIIELARTLAYRLYGIAERKGWNQEAIAYNALIQSWHDIILIVSEKKQKNSQINTNRLF